MKKTLYIITILLLLLAGCKNRVTDTTGTARRTPTDPSVTPELPYILEGDYTPDTGVLYKVIIGRDTCFVVIDSIDDIQLHGYYYQLTDSSDCVERKPFTYDRHWKDKRREAKVFAYQEPEYHSVADSLYSKPVFKISQLRNVEYGEALGYWVSMKKTGKEGYGEILLEGIPNSFIRTIQTLTMDIYSPANSDTKKPLVLLLHGGAFYIGDKEDSLISGLCRHFASLGYVAVSANYRLGFLPAKGEINRAGFMAVQDAHAAMRFLVDRADKYGIDTNLLFVGGASAGGITALNLAFMRDPDRPKQAYSNQWRDLGTIASSGNSSRATFHIKAVANMWGAVNNLNILNNSHTDIISFHGDADQVVPYDNGFPFNDLSIQVGKRLFDRMYGSLPIDKKAKELGYRSLLHTYNGEGHSLQRTSEGEWNQKNFIDIRDKITAFFLEEIAGKRPVIEEDRNDSRHFIINGADPTDVRWKVEGGFIVAIGNNEIWVVWDNTKTSHSLKASGHYNGGMGFNASFKPDIETNTEK